MKHWKNKEATKKFKVLIWEKLAQKIQQIEGVDVYTYVQIQNLNDSKQRNIADAKGRWDYLNCSITSLHKTSIILQNSNFIAVIASVEQFQYTLPRPNLVQK